MTDTRPKSSLSPTTQLDSSEDPLSAQCVFDLMKSLKVPAARWHYLAATDGSGTTGAAVGYSAVMIKREPYDVQILCGAETTGTNNDAEVRAVLLAVSYVLRNRPTSFTNAAYLHILTDSSYVKTSLDKLSAGGVLKPFKAHPHLWKAIQEARRHGVFVFGHQVPRNSMIPMICADISSKFARCTAVKMEQATILKDAVENVKSMFPLRCP